MTVQQADAPIKTAGGTTVQILSNPDFGYLDCQLAPGDEMVVESGAMASMSGGTEVSGRLMGGVFKSIARKLLGGESMFLGEYSHPEGGHLTLSPSLPGMVLHRRLKGESIFLQGGSFLASTPDVTMGVRFGGLRAFFSGEGVFFLEIAGEGDLWYNAIGTVVEHEVEGTFVVDTGHVVGWESTLDWTIGGMGGLKSTLLSGEGLVIKFSGRGKVWLQTRNQGGLVGWISGYCRG